MNTNTSIPAIAAEAALVSAGITFSVVETCSDERCAWCRVAALPAAA